MLMLKQTLATRNYDRPLNLEGPINFPPFPELVFGANEAQRIELSFDIDLGGDRRIFGLSEEAVRLSVSVTTAFDTAKQEMYREKVTGTIRGRENQMLNGWTEESLPGKPRRLTLRTAKRRSLNISMSESSRRPQSMLAGFFQLPLELLGPASRRQRIRDFLSESGIYGVDFSISAAFGESLSYIGPLRESPHRYYEAAGETPLDVGQQGERAVYILRGSAGRDRNSLLSHVRRWLVALGIAADVQVEEIAASLHRITVVDPHTGVVVNIADIGFGASQVLPIIVQGYFQEPDSVLLLEQPEIHLHARSQGVLADMFLDISKHLRRSPTWLRDGLVGSGHSAWDCRETGRASRALGPSATGRGEVPGRAWETEETGPGRFGPRRSGSWESGQDPSDRGKRHSCRAPIDT